MTIKINKNDLDDKGFMVIRNKTRNKVTTVYFPNSITVTPSMKIQGPCQIAGIFNAAEVREAGQPITPANFTFTPDVMLIQSDQNSVATPDRESDFVDLITSFGYNRELQFGGFATSDSDISGSFNYRSLLNSITASANGEFPLYIGTPKGPDGKGTFGKALVSTGSSGSISFYTENPAPEGSIGPPGTDTSNYRAIKLEFGKNTFGDINFRCLELRQYLSGTDASEHTSGNKVLPGNNPIALKSINFSSPFLIQAASKTVKSTRNFTVKKLEPGQDGASGKTVLISASPPVISVQSDAAGTAATNSGHHSTISVSVDGTAYTYDEPAGSEDGSTPSSPGSFSIGAGTAGNGGTATIFYSDGTSAPATVTQAMVSASTTFDGVSITGATSALFSTTSDTSSEIRILIDKDASNNAKVYINSFSQLDSSNNKTIISAAITLNLYVNIDGTVTSSPGVPVSILVVKNIPIEPLVVTTAPETIVVPASSAGAVSDNTQFASISATRGSTTLEAPANFNGTVSMDDRFDLNIDSTDEVTGTSTDVSGNTRALGSTKSGTDLQIKDGSTIVATFGLSTSGGNTYVLTLTQMSTNDAAGNELSSIQISIPYVARVFGVTHTGVESLSIVKSKQGNSPNSVTLTAASTIISYDAAGANPNPSSIAITANSIGFTDGHFKFTGGGTDFTDETTFTNTSNSTVNQDAITFNAPSSYSATPYTFQVEAREGATGTSIIDTVSIGSIKAPADPEPTVSLTRETITVSTNPDGGHPTKRNASNPAAAVQYNNTNGVTDDDLPTSAATKLVVSHLNSTLVYDGYGSGTEPANNKYRILAGDITANTEKPDGSTQALSVSVRTVSNFPGTSSTWAHGAPSQGTTSFGIFLRNTSSNTVAAFYFESTANDAKITLTVLDIVDNTNGSVASLSDSHLFDNVILDIPIRINANGALSTVTKTLTIAKNKAPSSVQYVPLSITITPDNISDIPLLAIETSAIMQVIPRTSDSTHTAGDIRSGINFNGSNSSATEPTLVISDRNRSSRTEDYNSSNNQSAEANLQDIRKSVLLVFPIQGTRKVVSVNGTATYNNVRNTSNGSIANNNRHTFHLYATGDDITSSSINKFTHIDQLLVDGSNGTVVFPSHLAVETKSISSDFSTFNMNNGNGICIGMVLENIASGKSSDGYAQGSIVLDLQVGIST